MKLLFICTHNRCRSILAEAITNHLSEGRILAASGGSQPQQNVHPKTLQYLAEHDIPIEGLRSQSWDEFDSFSPDAVITLCDRAAQEACPLWFDPSVVVHWGLRDPSLDSADEKQQRLAFAHTIEVIGQRVTRLLQQDLNALSGLDLQNQLKEIGCQIVENAHAELTT